MDQASEGAASASADAEGLRLLQACQDALQDQDVQAIEASANALLTHACAQMQKEPSQDLLCKMEAHEHEAAGRWQEAEAAYVRCLALAQAENAAMLEVKARGDLSGLYRFLGQIDRAVACAEAAVDAARRSDMETLRLMALEGVARCYLDVGKADDALRAAEEMLAIMRASSLKAMHGLFKARTLTLRARCYADRGETEAAERDLANALPLLAPLSGVALFAGVQSGLANWWSVRAQIKARQGDIPAAREAWQKSVDYARIVSQAEQLDGPYKYAGLARSLQKQAEFLRETGDATGAADKAMQEARLIRQTIHQPDGGI